MKSFLIAAALFAQVAPAGTRSGTIAGRVLAVDGTPAAGVRISALTASEQASKVNAALMSIAQTDEAGRYRLEDVPPGRYYIIAGALDGPTYFPGVTAQNSAAVVTVTDGAPMEGIDFRVVIPPVLRVKGRILVDGSAPPRRLFSAADFPRITLSGGASRIDAPIASDGTFDFAKVRPGNYQVSISSRNHSGITDPAVITVAEQDIAGLELAGRLNVTIAGTAGVEGGGPLPKFQLKLMDLAGGQGGRAGAAKIIAIGGPAFGGQLLTGEYRATVVGLPAGFTVKSMRADATDLLAAPFRVTAPGTPPPIAIELGVSSPSPWVTLSGRISGPAATQAATVSARGPAFQDALTTRIQPDGSFAFPMTLPGTYAITILPEKAYPWQMIATVAVGGAGLTNIEIVTPAGKETPGRVEVEKGGPLPLTVTFTLACPQRTLAPAPNSVEHTAVARTPEIAASISGQVAADGSFRVTLPESRCRIQAAPNSLPSGYVLKSLRYGPTDLSKDAGNAVSPGGPEDLRVTLGGAGNAALARLKGRLREPDPAVTRIVLWREVRPATPITFNGLTIFDRAGAFVPDGTVQQAIVKGVPVFFDRAGELASGGAALQANVNDVGSFELSGIATGAYSASLISSLAAPLPDISFNVPASGSDIEIALPRTRRVTIRTAVEGHATPSPFAMRIQGRIAAGPRVDAAAPDVILARSPEMDFYGFSVDVSPSSDGTFQIALPEGEYRLGVGPPAVKSIESSGVDLLANPLKITATDDAEIHVLFADPSAGVIAPRRRGVDPILAAAATIAIAAMLVIVYFARRRGRRRT